MINTQTAEDAEIRTFPSLLKSGDKNTTHPGYMYWNCNCLFMFCGVLSCASIGHFLT